MIIYAWPNRKTIQISPKLDFLLPLTRKTEKRKSNFPRWIYTHIAHTQFPIHIHRQVQTLTHIQSISYIFIDGIVFVFFFFVARRFVFPLSVIAKSILRRKKNKFRK